jgi:hypothetical protein
MFDTPDLVISELRALMLGRPIDGRNRLLRLYEVAKKTQRGRARRYEKSDFALYWLFRGLGIDSSSSPLIHRARPRATKKLEDFLERLKTTDEELYEALIDENEPELWPILRRYRKSQILERVMADGQEIAQGRENEDLADEVEKKVVKVNGLSIPELELIRHDLLELGAANRREIDQLWRQVQKESRLMVRTFRFIRGRMQHKNAWVKTRDLSRGLRKKNAELVPTLTRLRDEHHILWNQENRRVQANSYDPKDKRRFRWLAGSSWSVSQFEPYLEKGRVYQLRDFRAYVVEEWIRTGAAEWTP